MVKLATALALGLLLALAPLKVVTGLAASSASASASSTTTSTTTTTSTKIAGARRLGNTDLIVSEACLGTMTWGLQNTQEEAFAQIDYARQECGINFLDAAELYPVPFTAPTWKAGGTETIIGNYWRANPGAREQLVLATKVCGYMPESPVAAARDANFDDATVGRPYPDARLDAMSVKAACEASLRRLQTDYIDLYQIHWPDRYVPLFGQTLYNYNNQRDDAVPIEETVAALRDLIDAGKIRYIGVSNESPYGLAQWIQACEKYGIRDKLASIQNSYSLIDRRFDGDLAEICADTGIGLLPWSILAGGLLSGKYSSKKDGSTTASLDNARYTKYPEFMSRWSPTTASSTTLSAVDEYAAIAARANLTPAQLAVAWAKSRPFVAQTGSTIVGATSMEQLRENLMLFSPDSNKNMELDDEIIDAINAVHAKCPNPSCGL